MKNSLISKGQGLSMSEATSISNICFQKAQDISAKIAVINNYSKVVSYEGKELPMAKGNPLPENIVELIGLKAKYHATQAFLMENIKAKESLLDLIKYENFIYDVPAPQLGELTKLVEIPEVGEKWGREQLTLDEVNELLAVEAQAAHIGQFIHKGSILDNLRKELPTIKPLEWMEIEKDKKTPVTINIHHNSEQLSSLYEEFSALHRAAEGRVNFFKAKIKNLVSAENARIAEVNAVEGTRVNTLNQTVREEFTNARSAWNEGYKVAEKEFEANRNLRIKEASALKIKTAPQFQDTVDEILKSLKREKE